MIKEEKSFQSADEMSPELADAVLRWVLALSDTKQQIGLQFSHWVTGTPALEGAVGAAALTQDELGHARSLYGLLRDFPGAPEGIGAENDLEARQIYYAPKGVTVRWESWLQVIAINLLLDSALEIGIKRLANSTYHPLAGRVAKILQEEKFHRIFGEAWLQRLAQERPEIKPSLQAQTDWAFKIADEWLGPETDSVISQLFEAGVIHASGAEIRQEWLSYITPILTKCELEIPTPRSDWSTWDQNFRQCAEPEH